MSELAGSACDHGRTCRHATQMLQTSDYEYGVRGRWRPASALTVGNLAGRS